MKEPIGLVEDSVALCEQIRVIDKQRIIKTIGKLEDSVVSNIEKALKVILGIP